MRAVILLYAQDGYINIPVDNVKLHVNPDDRDDLSQGVLLLERGGKLVGMFQMSEVKGYYVTERREQDDK